MCTLLTIQPSYVLINDFINLIHRVVIGAPLDTLSNAEGYSKTGNIYLCPIRLDKNRSDVTECSELNLPDVGKIGKLTTVHFT